MHLETLERVSTPSFGVRLLHGVAMENGIDFARASQRQGLVLDPRPDGSTEISGPVQLKFDQCFTSITRDRPELWFALGLRMPPPIYGPMGMAVLTAPTFRHVMDLIPYSNHLHLSLIQITGRFEGNVPILDFDLTDVPEDVRGYMLMRELGGTIAVQRSLWGKSVPSIERIEIAGNDHHTPDMLHTGIRVVTGCNETRIILQEGSADRPLFNGDELLHAHYMQECIEKVRRLRDQGSSLEDKLAALVESAAKQNGRPPTLVDLAKAEHLSERTLQRRLQARGVNFRQMNDTARWRVAQKMLCESELSIGDVADLLGYSDASSFYHACKRWTQLSPRAYRAQLTAH